MYIEERERQNIINIRERGENIITSNMRERERESI